MQLWALPPWPHAPCPMPAAQDVCTAPTGILPTSCATASQVCSRRGTFLGGGVNYQRPFQGLVNYQPLPLRPLAACRMPHARGCCTHVLCSWRTSLQRRPCVETFQVSPSVGGRSRAASWRCQPVASSRTSARSPPLPLPPLRFLDSIAPCLLAQGLHRKPSAVSPHSLGRFTLPPGRFHPAGRQVLGRRPGFDAGRGRLRLAGGHPHTPDLSNRNGDSFVLWSTVGHKHDPSTQPHCWRSSECPAAIMRSSSIAFCFTMRAEP